MITHVTHDEKLQMCQAMERFGGGFVKALSECFIKADLDNLERLYKAFPEIVETYLKISYERMED